jgi:putative alpha-1,2-mannosidase
VIKLYRVSLLFIGIMALCLTVSAQKKKDYTPYVNPFIGTSGEGHTFPGAVLPYGMLQVGPITDINNKSHTPYYHYTDSVVYGFDNAHLSGIRYPDNCHILLMPTVGDPILNTTDYGSKFSKKNESASPGYYKTKLDKYDVDVELTATTRASIERYNYPSTKQANIIIDLRHNDGLFLGSSIEVINDHEIRGYLEAETTLYFYAKFSKPFKTYGIAIKDQLQSGIKKAEGNNIKLYLQFDNPGELISKVGISSVSVEGALKNLDTEIPDFDFKKVQKAAKAAWINELAKIDIEGGAPSLQQEQQQLAEQQGYNNAKPVKKTPVIDYGKIKRTIFYTALYHSMLAPNINSDVDGKYLGIENYGLVERSKVYTTEGFNYYTVFSQWKKFKTEYPVLNLIDHKRATDVIKSFLALYDKKDSLTRSYPTRVYCETGYQAIPIIADMYAKGIKDFNAEKAFEAMKDAENKSIGSLEYYLKTGFKVDDNYPTNILQYCYNDWCIAQIAKLLNKPIDYKIYIQRAQFWKNIHNKESGFFQPYDFDVRVKSFNPNEENSSNFREGNAWHYAFVVPYDINTLITRDGGKEKFTSKLDDFFTANVKGNNSNDIGYYNLNISAGSNTPYLYNFTDKADKTQFYINKILERYTDKPDGIPGKDDNGQLSSWYVMSALGIYNIAPGQQQFQIGLPQFDKAVINLENGKKFTIVNSGSSVARNNIYLQGMSLNKKAYNKLYLNYDDIANGGEFEVYTGRLANKMFMHDLEKPTSAITDELIVPNPTITLLKTFAPPTQVSINSNDIEPNTIYYTIDGSAPTTSSMVYSKSIPIAAKTIIKAIAVKNGRSSFVTEAHY